MLNYANIKKISSIDTGKFLCYNVGQNVNFQKGGDRLKLDMPQISANKKLKNRLCNDILSNKLSHAYIIEGAPGTGRHLLARSIAMSVACMNKNTDGIPLPCNKCESCRKIANDLCPDVVICGIEKGKSSVGVDTARFIKTDINIHPNDIDYKIYIIEEADHMTEGGQNALLLTLEEPPEYAIIILICEKADSLLETIRSRAPIIRTERVDKELIKEHLLNDAPSEITTEAQRLERTAPEDFDEIISASNGSIGMAYRFLIPEKRAEVLKKREQVRSFVESALNSSPKSTIFDLALSFPTKRDDLIETIGSIILAIRDLLVLKKSENAPLCFYAQREIALDLSSSRSAAYLLKLLAACEEASSALINNSNVKLTMTILASKV